MRSGLWPHTGSSSDWLDLLREIGVVHLEAKIAVACNVASWRPFPLVT
jgi:hypothetical protein